MLIDLHVSSRFSPGCDLDPALVVERAEALGLDGVCFTDLNTLEGAAELHALRARAKIAVLVGVKVATDHGHYLCFFPDPETTPEPAQLFGAPPPGGKGFPAREVVETVKARGGAVVVAHPYDRELERPAGDFIFTLKGLSAVEGLNGRRRPNVNELAIEAADHLALPCTGGSDARTLEDLGTAATLFRDAVRDEGTLVEALKSGAVWAVSIGTPPKFPGDELYRHQPDRERERRPERHDRPRGDDRRRGRRRGGRR